MSKNNEIQKKSEHKIAFPQNDKNALTTFLHSHDELVPVYSCHVNLCQISISCAKN